MIMFLLIAVIVLTVVLLSLIVWLWIQYIDTNSSLYRIIERRIALAFMDADETIYEEEDDND